MCIHMRRGAETKKEKKFGFAATSRWCPEVRSAMFSGGGLLGFAPTLNT
jgi:hypothetical protein